jgi:hypothetical protein
MDPLKSSRCANLSHIGTVSTRRERQVIHLEQVFGLRTGDDCSVIRSQQRDPHVAHQPRFDCWRLLAPTERVTNRIFKFGGQL